ncbi:hypothetical protein [Rufibacter ruber]|uniref:hypothetical protein n=1 Tax=Rufibacter ruber TaxID=1783499 RepID=UPI00082ED523|nr:hypothetical protein [Rufibacter ruber]
MKTLLIAFVFFLAFIPDGAAQSGWEAWDKNYRLVHLPEVLKLEQQYADSIDRTAGESSYYIRHDKYRFMAIFLGESRPVDPKVLGSMKNVFKLSGGEPDALGQNVVHEYLFQVGETKFWAPMQKQLEKSFRKEVKPKKLVLLYGLFLNEHSSNGLFNTLLISEFQAK